MRAGPRQGVPQATVAPQLLPPARPRLQAGRELAYPGRKPNRLLKPRPAMTLSLTDPAPPATELAQLLLGARLTLRGAGGRITETEAYTRDDPASHSFAGPRPRNRAMFGPAFHAYVYRIYGLHLCLNIVGRPGEAVLIRALEPETGLDLMQARRGAAPLASGPGRLAQALGLRLEDDGQPLFEGDFQLVPAATRAPAILVGPRIGITRAAERPWRFGLPGPWLSRAFPAPSDPPRSVEI